MNDLLYWLRKSLTYTIDGDTVKIGSKVNYSDNIDSCVAFPPKKRYAVKGRIASRKKGEPTIIDGGLG